MAAQPARENRSSPKHDPEARLRSFSTRRFRHEILPAHGFMGIRRSQLLSFAPARPKSFIGLLNRVLAGAQSKPELPEKSSRRAAFTNLPTSRNRVVAAYPGSGHRLEIEIAKFRLRNPPGNFSQSRRLLPAARTPSYPDALVVIRSDIQSASLESRRSDMELLLLFRPGCRLLRRLLPPRRHGRLVSIPVHHCHNLHSRRGTPISAALKKSWPHPPLERPITSPTRPGTVCRPSGRQIRRARERFRPTLALADRSSRAKLRQRRARRRTPHARFRAISRLHGSPIRPSLARHSANQHSRFSWPNQIAQIDFRLCRARTSSLSRPQFRPIIRSPLRFSNRFHSSLRD